MKKEAVKVIKQLFGKKKKSYVPAYLKRFETIDKLIAEDCMAIDLKSNLVVLDSSIHVLYINDDRKYSAFFDTLRAYMNFCRGRLQMEQMIEYSDRINFLVVLKQYAVIDTETGEFFEKQKETTKTLLVGYYKNGVVEYAAYEDEKEKS